MKLNIIFSRWLPLLLWAAFIFLLSSIPEPLDQAPSALAQALEEMRLLGVDMVTIISFIIHCILYLVLGFLAARALTRGRPISFPLLLAAFLVCALYAFSDEFHQTFVPGRGFEWIDLLADGLGTAAGIGILLERHTKSLKVPVK